jgi:hypothetical protein
MRQRKDFGTRVFVFALAVLVVSALSLGVVLATSPQDDGRINQVHHFGGDALYCVDANGLSTNQYADFAAFRLLNISGSILWEVSAETLSEALATPDQGVLIAQGSGSFGPAWLWGVAPTGSDPVFTFMGYDEYGKSNSMTFTGCQSVGPEEEGAAASSSGGGGDDGGGPNETPEAPNS